MKQIVVDISEESTRDFDNGYTICTITAAATTVLLEMMGTENDDSGGSGYTTISCRNNDPTRYTDYTPSWQLQLERYTLIVNGITLAKDKPLPIKNETIRKNNIDYIITYSYSVK